MTRSRSAGAYGKELKGKQALKEAAEMQVEVMTRVPAAFGGPAHPQAARTLMSKARFFLAKGDATGGAQALRDAFEALKDKNVLEARKAAKMTCVLLRAGKKGEAAAAAVEAEAAALKLL